MRYLTKLKKRLRKETNAKEVNEIYARAKQGGSEDYLIGNQPSDPDRVAKILATAESRRKRKGLSKTDLNKPEPSQKAGIYGSKDSSGLFKDSRGTLYINAGGTILKIREV